MALGRLHARIAREPGAAADAALLDRARFATGPRAARSMPSISTVWPAKKFSGTYSRVLDMTSP